MSIKTLALFLILSGALLFGQVSSMPDAAVKAALNSDWPAVAELLKPARPDSAVEGLLLGHACLALNRNNDSLNQFLSFSSPDSLTAWNEWTTQLTQKHPDNKVARYLHGDSLARLQKWDDAIREFDEGLRLARPTISCSTHGA